MALSAEQITKSLSNVMDPELGKDLVSLKMVKDIQIQQGHVDLTIELTTPACPLKDKIESDIRAEVSKIADVQDIKVTFTADVARASPQGNAKANNPLPNIKHIIAIGAGKGGVGKSTVSVNVAVALARFGASSALLDADIYGPSAPTLLGLDDMPPRTVSGTTPEGEQKQMIVAFEKHGIASMTIGKMVEPDKALIWRGPMAHGAFRQLATQTEWGDRDYLIIDLPPGTGDVPLTMSQLMPLTGAVVVCTPQKVAQDDAYRAVSMFRQLQVPVLGIVENMSYFIGDDGKEYDIFGKGGAKEMADKLEIPFLGSLPINMDLRRNSDSGEPLKNFDNPQLAEPIIQVAQNLAGQISMQALKGDQTPTLSIA